MQVCFHNNTNDHIHQNKVRNNKKDQIKRYHWFIVIFDWREIRAYMIHPLKPRKLLKIMNSHKNYIKSIHPSVVEIWNNEDSESKMVLKSKSFFSQSPP